jgi:hypothetical protein
VSTYDDCVARLIKRIRQMNGDWSPTPLRNELLDIRKQLLELAERLEGQSVAQFDLEEEHDQEPPPIIGADGLPVGQTNYGASYKATLWHMRDLADSALRASENLRKPRERLAIPFAALALLHLKCWHGKTMPRLSNTSPDVKELSDICDEAGMPRSIEVFRNALSRALDKFDPHFYPPGVYEILTGCQG